MKNKSELLITAIAILIIVALLPVVKAVFKYAMLAVIGIIIYVWFDSRKIKKEIEKDPDAYFEKQQQERDEK